MPRELGKAKRSDLTGRFPGEQAEYGSALARFLEGSGQLHSLEDGTYLDTASGNGNGSSTEVPRNQTEVPTRSSDTEVAPAPGGNGQHSDNGSDTLFDTAFAQDDMFPEPAEMQPQMLEPGGDATAELEPVTFEPSAATLHPDAPEPEALDSVPDLTSPELDHPDDSEDEEEADTDILDRRDALPTIKPRTDELPQHASLAPQSSGDTGILEPEEIRRVPPDERINLDELSAHDDDETGILEEEGESERITSKVEPRRDTDPRAADPNAVVRDTVNFYNQTQSLHEQKKAAGGFPTISPQVVNSTQPLDIKPEDALAPEPMAAEAPDLLAEDESETDTLKPGLLQPLAAEPASLEVLSPAQELSPAPYPGSEDATRLVHPIELEAEADIEDADKRETDKFNEDDRRPPPLPQPEGTDKLDKRQVAAGGTEPRQLEPLADEKVASGKDTQRFYVAEILAKKEEHTGDTTAELQPAEEGPPRPLASSDTTADYGTDTEHKSAETRREPAPERLPTPSQVHTDFIEHVETAPSERIIPEIGEDAEIGQPGPEYEPALVDNTGDSDDTVDEEADDFAGIDLDNLDEEERKITEKVKRYQDESATVFEEPIVPAPQPAQRERETVAATSGERVRHITDSLSQRLKAEREDTLRLIEQAEAVAIRLREAAEQSRTDLVAISARRAKIGGNGSNGEHALPEPAHQEDYHDSDLEDLPGRHEPEPETPPETPARVAAPRPEPAPAVARRSASRVPTRAIGKIISELEQTAQGEPVSLTELLEEVSRRGAPAPEAADEVREEDEEDLDLLVAASSRWREIIEREEEAERSAAPVKHSRRHSARSSGAHEAVEPEPEPASTRAAAASTLSSDLDRLWEVLDSRRTATVVLPPSERTRAAPREKELWEGWTQEMLWPTLAGIAGVTFVLGALFIWVLMKWAA